ncbi:hypothetical protein AAES_162457 [Amazona aestiva]|uniref:Uncharacterized protein n=1 Tax=Amazona aestiva TaxID=12930 RepID=A0A0Q3T0C4_AMAAE|nr:hypothetical protein AAES_162457 [Amazona aestiva]
MTGVAAIVFLLQLLPKAHGQVFADKLVQHHEKSLQFLQTSLGGEISEPRYFHVQGSRQNIKELMCPDAMVMGGYVVDVDVTSSRGKMIPELRGERRCYEEKYVIGYSL